MTERENSNLRTLTLNAVSIALVAALATQVFHESCHAVAVVLVGARLEWFNLFGVSYVWVAKISRWGHIIIAGNAALMNILTGTIAVALFSRRWVMRRPTLRLFALYFGGFSLLAGFANLIIAALLYRPGGQNAGDWERVLCLLDGGLAARIAMGLVGAIGNVWVYSWLVRSTLRFGEGMTERLQRGRVAVRLMMYPYLVVSLILTILAFWHPDGSTGLFWAISQYWYGYVAFFVVPFGMFYWTKVRTPPPDATPFPDQLSWPWIAGAAVALGIAITVLLPTIYFQSVGASPL